jgi:hypothetical protein
MSDYNIVCTTNGRPLFEVVWTSDPKPRQQRRPSKTYAARLAKKEDVVIEIRPDDTMVISPLPTKSDDVAPNALDQWMAKHAN